MTYIQSIFLGNGPRPNSAHNVFSYDPNPSTINYNSPNHQSQQQQQQQQPPPNNINRINKTSPAPAQTAWTLRQVRKYYNIAILSYYAEIFDNQSKIK